MLLVIIVRVAQSFRKGQQHKSSLACRNVSDLLKQNSIPVNREHLSYCKLLENIAVLEEMPEMHEMLFTPMVMAKIKMAYWEE